MKKVFLVYVVAYLVLLVYALSLLYAYPKPELHLWLNSYHTHFLDVFFTYYSTLAEWPLYAVALLPMLWKRAYFTVFFAICEMTGGVLLQILKHIISMPRPASLFEAHPDLVLPVVEGVNLHHGNSFPSGHASTFFVFFTCCALLLVFRNPHESQQSDSLWSRVALSLSLLVLLALAALGAYSRVYLSQHFLADVCMGSFMGVVIPCLLFYFGRDKILEVKTKQKQ